MYLPASITALSWKNKQAKSGFSWRKIQAEFIQLLGH
jgi:hypothetical protein